MNKNLVLSIDYLYRKARSRINRNKLLLPYIDVLLDEDYIQDVEYLIWLNEETTDEILRFAMVEK